MASRNREPLKPLVYEVHDTTKSIGLDEDTCERIERRKRPDETFSEAIDRLTRTVSLAELGGIVDWERVELFIERMDQNQELFQKFMDDDEVQDIITDHLRKEVYEESQAEA